MFNLILYIVTGILLFISFRKDAKKTVFAIQQSWKIFEKMLPQFTAILLFVGIILSIVSPGTIQEVIGTKSGLPGMAIAALIGSITIIPVLIVFPIAATLLKNGAGLTQIAVFISTLVSVGFITMPLECRYLGKKVAILRNSLAFLFSFVVASIIGAWLS